LADRQAALARRTAADVTPPPPSAFAAFGDGSWIVPPARVVGAGHIHVGRAVTVLEGSWLSVVGEAPRLVIGDGTRIGRFVHIACVGEVVIGEDVLTADQVYIADSHHGYDPDQPGRPMAPPRPVRIGRGAFLGIRSVVLEGVTIGENAYVGAGAVVTTDVPDRAVVVGNPARILRRWDMAAQCWVSGSG
jgi:acetyltransferase-like isoleucine patch superfamily enzyme